MHIPHPFDDHINSSAPYRYVNRLRAFGFKTHEPDRDIPASGPSCVWLTCDDQVLDPIVQKLEDTQSVIVLRTNGRPLWMPGCWPTDQSLRLGYSLAERSVRAMVVCGHWRCAAEESVSSRKFSDWLTGSGGNVVERVARQQTLHRQAQDLFAERIRGMQRLPNIARAIEEKGISFCGMWYLPETGYWMRYAPDQGWSESTDFDFESRSEEI